AALDAERVQRAGEAPAPLGELTVGALAAVLDERNAIGMDRARPLQKRDRGQRLLSERRRHLSSSPSASPTARSPQIERFLPSHDFPSIHLTLAERVAERREQDPLRERDVPRLVERFPDGPDRPLNGS